jgi:hypothetical protein
MRSKSFLLIFCLIFCLAVVIGYIEYYDDKLLIEFLEVDEFIEADEEGVVIDNLIGGENVRIKGANIKKKNDGSVVVEFNGGEDSKITTETEDQGSVIRGFKKGSKITIKDGEIVAASLTSEEYTEISLQGNRIDVPKDTDLEFEGNNLVLSLPKDEVIILPPGKFPRPDDSDPVDLTLELKGQDGEPFKISLPYFFSENLKDGFEVREGSIFLDTQGKNPYVDFYAMDDVVIENIDIDIKANDKLILDFDNVDMSNLDSRYNGYKSRYTEEDGNRLVLSESVLEGDSDGHDYSGVKFGYDLKILKGKGTYPVTVDLAKDNPIYNGVAEGQVFSITAGEAPRSKKGGAGVTLIDKRSDGYGFVNIKGNGENPPAMHMTGDNSFTIGSAKGYTAWSENTGYHEVFLEPSSFSNIGRDIKGENRVAMSTYDVGYQRASIDFNERASTSTVRGSKIFKAYTELAGYDMVKNGFLTYGGQNKYVEFSSGVKPRVSFEKNDDSMEWRQWKNRGGGWVPRDDSDLSDDDEVIPDGTTL